MPKSRFTDARLFLTCCAVTFYCGSVVRADDHELAVPLPGKIQSLIPFPVQVVDVAGNPVEDVRLGPWALRTSQGHRIWKGSIEHPSGLQPREATTDQQGRATLAYPSLGNVNEGTRTLSVSLFADHPDFVFQSSIHIDVPTQSDVHQIVLAKGISRLIRPTLDGKPWKHDDFKVVSSDQRKWFGGTSEKLMPDGRIRLAPFPTENGSILIVRLSEGRATHFSQIVDLEPSEGSSETLDVPMRPATVMHGNLATGNTRPIVDGRVVVQTLNPTQENSQRAGWYSWAEVERDGSFTIDSWPSGEAMQLIALTDTMIAASGEVPPEASQTQTDGDLLRPQVFRMNNHIEKRIVPMTPMIPWQIRVVDEEDQPVPGIEVASWPNVRWWNSGSQIYASALVRSEDGLLPQGKVSLPNKDHRQPFFGTSDAEGMLTMNLPAGENGLALRSQFYELPIFMGFRHVKIQGDDHSKNNEITLRVQPTGTEKLGDWDKLAGVVFGCSTREGRRICALPSIRNKMDEFARQFREGKNRKDPRLMAEAYSLVSEAFAGVGDHGEAVKWKRKAAEQLSLVQPDQE
ncbi:MAG: hypothetical protein AAF989_06035 [Planctomycetota bacterium]